ncbi:MAG: sugar MFS transporter [Flavobacteriales bacterium]|nr:sugar MFS transporter [Flavobacteriales bacterium]
MSSARSTTRSFVVVTTLFFMWGFITVLIDSLIPRLREVFELSYFQAGMVQFAFFIAYLVVSFPAGTLLSSIGYKRGMILGLATMGLGCALFWPAAGLRSFPLFMAGFFTLASGITVLQVAANPYVAALGDERGASSRLNLAQAFNSMGTTIAPVLGAMLILSDRIRSSADIALMDASSRELYLAQEASAVQGPFMIIAGSLALLAVVVSLVDLPRILEERAAGTYGQVLRNGRLMGGAVGIFVYVGAEVAIGSYLVNYFLSMDLATTIQADPGLSWIATTILGSPLLEVDAKGVVGAFVALYWGGAMVGRFFGAFLTRSFAPSTVLAVFGTMAALMVALSMVSEGTVAMWAILSVGLFNSIMFPTIFSLAVEGLGDLKPRASGVLCTAIVGGAFIPPFLGSLADDHGFKVAFLLLVVCYAYITAYAWRLNRSAA